MSRRRRAGDDSLELLLDTICNTFGGVLFLAMLVSLLLAQTSRKTDGVASAATPRPALAAADIVRLEARAAAAAEELTRLQGLKHRLQQLQGTVSDGDSDDAMWTELAELEDTATQSETSCTRILIEAAEQQAAAARARKATVEREKQKQTLEAKLMTARTRLSELRQERQALALAAAEAARPTTIKTAATAPRERATSKQEFGVMLRFGRLYLLHRYSDTGRSVNDEEFFVTPGTFASTATAKPTKGLDLHDQKADDLIGDRLRDHPPDEWYACLVVNPDSFAAFPVLKNWLVQHGYEYRVIPTGEPVIDQGSDESRVQ